MLYLDRIAAALTEKRVSFSRQEGSYTADLAAYRTALRGLGRRYPTADALLAALEEREGARGALPLPAYDAWAAEHAHALPLLPFGQAFPHHEAARAWAEETIRGTTTVAVDGSQILPWPDASIPVAVVQAGIFVNAHDPAGKYQKDVVVEVLAPDDLLPVDGEEADGISAEAIVNLRRFELECRTIAEWMRQHPVRGDERPMPVAILDGSLIVSFAFKMHPYLRTAYVMAAMDLLAASESCRVPLIAYIDTSRARDLVGLLRALDPSLPSARRLNDALLWGDGLAWGDAALPWRSARGDILVEYGARRHAIAFTSIRAAADRPPARVELPGWVAEDPAIFARVMDVLRAELIAGNGYPYAIETADVLAVIGIQDRERFYQLFQRYATESDLPLSFSRKALSKSRRR